MTQTPGASSPPITITTLYGIEWSVENGTTDTTTEGLDGEPEFYPFATTGSFNAINFDSIEKLFYQLVNYQVCGYLASWTKSTTESPDGPASVVWSGPFPIPYTLNSLTITPSHESNEEWAKLNQYGEMSYGGVLLDTTKPFSIPTINPSCCGPTRSGVRTYPNGKEVVSGYNFFSCFEQAELDYYPRNSIALNLEIVDATEEPPPNEPYYPDVVDEQGRPAPIYPIDTITSAVADNRESITVTYTVTMNVTTDSIIPIVPINPTLTVSHTVIQGSKIEDMIEKYMGMANWPNPGEFERSSMSPGFPINYSYTLISGLEDVPTNREPTTRGDDAKEVGQGELMRGDIWYDPSVGETGERKYWRGYDIVSELEVVEGGDNYVSLGNVVGVIDLELDISDTRNNKLRSPSPYGLRVSTETKNGKIVSLQVLDGGYHFMDGDIVTVTGGNGKAKAKVTIEEAKWITEREPEIGELEP